MNIEVKTEKPTIPPVKITIGEQTIEISREDAKRLCDDLCHALYGSTHQSNRNPLANSQLPQYWGTIR